MNVGSRLSPALVSVLAAVSTLVAVGCESAETPVSTASASAVPTPTAPVIDACIVGTWRATVGMLPQTFEGAPVTATGGAGTVLTYNADGSYSGDFAKAQPYVATTSDGHRISVTATGSVVGTFTTIGGELNLTDSHTTLTVTVRVDGAVTSSAAASSTSSAEYTCTAGSHLTLSADGFATQYIPVH
jgi:hypothetical protein